MPPPDGEQARWFAQEVRPHEAELRSFLRRRFPALTPEDVADLVQETYVRLFRAHSSGGISEIRPYLFVTARNAAYDVFRRQQIAATDNLAEIDRLAVLEESPNAAEIASQDQEFALLAAAIEALPDRCREILKLRKLHGLSHREIAGRLGISQNTVNAQIATGVLRCRAYLMARGVSPATLTRAQLRIPGTKPGA